MKNFVLWLLRKIGNNIISFPKSHFKWYKHGLCYDTGLFIFYTMGRFIGTGILLALIGIAINSIFAIRSDNVILGIIAFMYVYYVIEFFTVIISIQYDKYTNELQKTMDALKRKDYSLEEEDDITTRIKNLQSYAAAQQQAFNQAANQNVSQGFSSAYQNYGQNQP